MRPSRSSAAVLSGSAPSSERALPAPTASSLSTSRRRGSPRPAITATDTRIADADTVEWLRAETGGFGVDYTFEATGNVAVMRQAVESAREAWGLATMCGVAGKGELLEVVPRFLITGRRVTGTSFGGVKGRTQVPLLVERWLSGEIDAHTLSVSQGSTPPPTTFSTLPRILLANNISPRAIPYLY